MAVQQVDNRRSEIEGVVYPLALAPQTQELRDDVKSDATEPSHEIGMISNPRFGLHCEGSKSYALTRASIQVKV